MKILISIVGVLLIIMGIVWILQGINILPGSFMTGQLRWAVFGSLAVIVGILVVVFANKKRVPRPTDQGPRIRI